MDEVAELVRPSELVSHRALILLVFPADSRQEISLLDGDQLTQADCIARRGQDQRLPEFVQVDLAVAFELHRVRYLVTSHLDCGAAGNPSLHRGADLPNQVRHRNPVLRGAVAVDDDGEFRGALAAPGTEARVGIHVPDARLPAELGPQDLGDIPHLLVVVPQDLDAVVPPTASTATVEGRAVPVDPNLGACEPERVGEELLLDAYRHVRVFQVLREGHDGTALGGIYVGGKVLDLGHLEQPFLEELGELVGAFDVGAPRKADADRDVRRLAPATEPYPSSDHVLVEEVPRPREEQDRNEHGDPRPSERAGHEAPVKALVEGFVAGTAIQGCRIPLWKQFPDQRGYEGKGHHHRSYDAEDDHDRHRQIVDALLTGQIEERRVHDQGGECGRHDREHHLPRAFQNGVPA